MGNCRVEKKNQEDRFERVIQHYSIEQLKLILRFRELSPDSAVVIRGKTTTVLNYCAQNGRPSVLKYLIENLKADPNKEHNNQTPLISAIQGNSFTNFTYLLNHPKIKPQVYTANNTNAILEAARNGKEEMFEELLRRNIDTSHVCLNFKDASPVSIERWYQKYVVSKRLSLFWMHQKLSVPKVLVKEISSYM